MIHNSYKIQTDTIYVVGDIHGAFNAIPYNIKQRDLRDCIIIFCGDIGIGFEKEQYYRQMFKKISKTLSSRNIHLFFGRGNHDCPQYFDGNHFKNYKYIHVIPDYTVITTVDEIDLVNNNILYVGGATSVDRTHRMMVERERELKYMFWHNCSPEEAKQNTPKVYWEDEAPVYNEEALSELKEKGIKIDIVCTHTCPSFCKPLTKEGISYWITKDPELDNVIDNERNVMDKIYNKLREDGHPLHNWIYGHYHFHNYERISDVNFRLLDMERNGNFDIIDIR